MNIIYIGRYNESEEISGPEKVAKRIFNLAEKEHNTAFIEYFFDGTKYGIIKKLFGYENTYEGDKRNIFRLGLFRILPFIIKFKPEILHIITFERFSLVAYLYKIFTRARIIYSVHGIAKYENKNFKKLTHALKTKDAFCEKIFISFSDMFLFLSIHQLNIAKKYYKIKDSKIRFINNGIDKEFSAAAILHEVHNDVRSLVFIGDSDRKDKDFNFLYSSLEKISEKCNLYIIGKFNKDKYKTKIGNVSIIAVDRVSKDLLIKNLIDKDIFISSSFYDTFSIAAAECMSMGLVPIVTDTTGISKLIANGENGYIVKHGNRSELAERINTLLKNNILRKEMSCKAVQIYKQLNWENIFSSYEKVYNELINA